MALNRYQAKVDQFFIKESNGDFKLLLGKFHGKLLSEISDLKYLKTLSYRSYLKPTPEFTIALNKKISELNQAAGKSHGLYFFYTHDKTLLYVGKSDVDIIGRLFVSFDIRQRECNNQIKYVQLMLPKTISDTDILEQWFIKFHKPSLNVTGITGDDITIKIGGLYKIPRTDYLELIYDGQFSHQVNPHISEAYKNLIN